MASSKSMLRHGSQGSWRSRGSPRDLANAGMYAFHPSALNELEVNPPQDIAYNLLPQLIGRARAIAVEGYFRDIGTVVGYCRAQEEWQHSRVGPMIITQTPLRIGLVGGGTDLPSYYLEHGGRVLNCAIDKYVYVIVKQRFDDDIYVNYSKKEVVSRVEDLEHELVREAMVMTGVTHGVEITTLADIPSTGSGLGSSSSVTVGLLHALLAYQGRQVAAEELAEQACTIEIERCAKPIGKQDQYIAALGGILDLRFGPGDQVRARELGLSTVARRALQEQIMLFYTGVTRNADTILHQQRANVDCTLSKLHFLRDLAGSAIEHLHCGDIEAVGTALRQGWEAKRELASGVSNNQIDLAVERALEAGAQGAKVTGAGGGGFMLVICPIERQSAVRRSLAEMPELPVKLDHLGLAWSCSMSCATSGADEGDMCADA